MSKTTHLIEEYKVQEDTILCCCGWKDRTDFFPLHQEISPPTLKVPTPSPYDAGAYNGPINNVDIDKGITWTMKDKYPDLYDYFNSMEKESIPEIFVSAPVETEEF